MSVVPHLIEFEQIGNAVEGYITTTQFAERIPFEIKRVFWTHGIPGRSVRGQHANKTTEEVLVAVGGVIKVKTEDVNGMSNFELTSPGQGLYIPALCWTELVFEDNSIGLCMASTDFDETDYIRDYPVFQKLKSR